MWHQGLNSCIQPEPEPEAEPEVTSGPSSMTGDTGSPAAFTCELSALLRRTVPGAEITFDMPSRPLLYEPGTLAYDFATLIQCVDYFMVMDCKMRRCFLVDFISLSLSLSGQASRSLR